MCIRDRAPLELAALGVNCGNNIADSEAAALEIKATLPEMTVVIKANAGIPEFKGSHLHYTGTPEIMGAHLKRMKDAGIEVIGGCCGTSTQHLTYMRGVIDGTITPPDVEVPEGSPSTAADADTDRPRRRRRRG